MALNNAPIQQAMLLNNQRPTDMWVKWFSFVANAIGFISSNGSYQPPALTDVQALPNSIYYSTDQGKLVYKDSLSVVNDLY